MSVTKCFLLIPLILLFKIVALSQISESTYNSLRQELNSEINALRIEKGAKPLASKIILKKAAKIQCTYMVKTRKLSHEQVNPKFANPLKRVQFFKGYDYDLVGENVLSSRPIELPLRGAAIKKLAHEMFTSWNESPVHYANMINPNYEFGGIEFLYSSKENIIYATQVFAKQGVKIEGQLSENSFGLTKNEEDCNDNIFKDYSNILANMGNAVYIRGNKVMLYYHDIEVFKEIFRGPKDGIAIDLIFRDQLLCDSLNKLDVSPIYDGILLKPVYRDEILQNNTAKSDYRIISPVGHIPDLLLQKQVSCSIIFIKNGNSCRYRIPGYVHSEEYDLISLTPRLINPNTVKLKNRGIVASEEITYNFKTNQPQPISLPNIDLRNQKIHSLEITSFSSVEGNEISNASLHTERAHSIKKHILTKSKNKNIPISIEAKENWDKMYFQLRYHLANDLADLPKDSIKNLLDTENNRLPWDSLLYEQRKSSLTINFEGSFSEVQDKEKWLAMNFKTALSDKSYDLANRVLFNMYESNIIFEELLFEDFTFRKIMESPQLTQNVAALLSKTYTNDPVRTIEFLFNWMNKEELLSEDAKRNLIHLYTIISIDLLDDWDISSQRLSNVVHPDVVRRLGIKNLQPELVLNLNLVFIQYFGQINDGPSISKAFNFITSYFSAGNLSIEDEVKLSLFFNSWSRYDLCIKQLRDDFDEISQHEEALFTLVQTVNFYPEYEDLEDYKELHQKAVDLNSGRWCTWVRRSFQLLRDQSVKDLFCEKCYD